MLKKRLVLLLALAMIMALMAGCGANEPAGESSGNVDGDVGGTEEPSPVAFTFASGADGGTWFLISGLISEIVRQKAPGSNVTVMPGAGSGNPVTVANQQFDVGMAFSSYALMAYQGVEDYADKGGPFTELREVLFLNNPNYIHIMASKGLPYDSLQEIVDNKYPLKFSPGPRGASPDLVFSWILAEYGVTYDDIRSWGGSVEYVEYSDATGLFSDGHIEMIVQATALGAATPLEMMSTGKTKMLPLETDVIDSLAEKRGLIGGVIPANRYEGQTEELPSLYDSPVIFSNTAMSEDTVYTLTKIICENNDFIAAGYESFKEFIPEEHAATDIGVPFHPGAEKYYREMGWIS
jgi:TRAP transporter TAXI family solute receptor